MIKSKNSTWTARLPQKLKTAPPQASNKFINHETLQYKCFWPQMQKNPYFLTFKAFSDKKPGNCPEKLPETSTSS